MKTRISVSLFIILFVILSAILYNANKSERTEKSIDFKRVATLRNPVVSQSGKYQIRIIEKNLEGTKHNSFIILKLSDANDATREIFTCKDFFRTRDTLYFLWDKNDRVWVYSGDTGTFFWERISDEDWQKHAYSENRNVLVPELLKKLKPDYYD